VFVLQAAATNRLLQAVAVYSTSEEETFVLETVESFNSDPTSCPPAWQALKPRPLPSFVRAIFKPKT
jgi:hypothetical protein